MKRTLLSIVAIVALVAMFCLFNVSTVSATTTIKFQSVYPKTSFLAENLLFFAEKVDEYTKGEVKIKLYWPGQLVRMKESFAALQRGMIEGLALCPLYVAGVVPEGNGEFLPYSWGNATEAIDIFLNYGYLDLMKEAFAKHGVHYLVPLDCASMGLMTTFPVHKVEDLKGKKIKTSGLSGEAIKLLGGTPTVLSPTEQYMGLQRGTIEGTVYPLYTINTYKFYEVLDYVILPTFHTPATVDILFNAEVWDKLSPANKDAISRAGLEVMRLAVRIGDEKDEIGFRTCKEKGVEVITLSSKEAKRFREILFPIYESHAKKSDLCARQVEIIKAYWKEKGK